MFGDKSSSLPNSSSNLNQTCFPSFSSACGEASYCWVLFLNFWDLDCKQRFSMEWWSHLSAGWDHGGLREGDWCWLGCVGEGLWHGLDPLLPLDWVCFFKLDHLLCHSLSQACCPSTGPWECLLIQEGNSAGPLFLCRPASGHPSREFSSQLPHKIFLLWMGEHTGHYQVLTPVDFLHDPQDVWVLGLN